MTAEPGGTIAASGPVTTGSGPETTGPGPGSGGPGRLMLGPLGRRLLAAFVLVALSSVAVLTVAALIGTDRGLISAQQQGRDRAAERAAAAATTAYTAAGGWNGADLTRTQAVAEAVQAQLVVRDTTGAMVWPGRGQAMGGPHRGMHAAGADVVDAPVTVDSRRVGTVSLVFAGAAAGGRGVAWGWVIGAGAVALIVALAASWFVTRRLATPLVRLTRTARAFAGGDRTARSHVRAPGELGELARTFDSMAEEVVRAEQVRRRLAADVAHELRTPLASLQAGLEELRDGLAEPEPARLAGLHDQALRLGRVVEDLGQLSAAESAALSLRLARVDLGEVAAAALGGQEPALRAAGLRITSDIRPVPVRADADRLHQAIVNLLANTARYCRPGDSVGVRVARDDGHAVVHVRDTGPGIAAQDLPHVFERLWRGHGSAAVAGSGIGLAVVRELVAAHGGTVSVESMPGEGATFTIRLPVDDRPR